MNTLSLTQEPIVFFLTRKAVIKITSLLALSRGSFLHLSIMEGGCRDYFYDFSFEPEKNTEQWIRPLLYCENKNSIMEDTLFPSSPIRIEKKFCILFHRSLLDFVENFMEESFEILRNPQVEKNCSCGQSFDAMR